MPMKLSLGLKTATYVTTPPTPEVNLFTAENDFTNAAWEKLNTSVSANAVTDPDGGTAADNLIEPADTNKSHYTRQSLTTINGGIYRFSVYAKEIAGSAQRYLLLRIPSALFTGNYGANFNLSNGTVNNASAQITPAIEAIGNGWYKCSLTAIATANGSSTLLIGLANSAGSISNFAYDGVSGNGLSLYKGCCLKL